MRIRGNFCLTEINNESIESRGGGGGVLARLLDNSSDNVFFLFIYSSTYLKFYRGYPMVISKKTIIFQGFRGGSNINRGGGGGGGGIKMLNAIHF